MIKNYIRVAWRNLVKNKVFSLINILGLAIGLAVCFLITLFVVDELSYDKYNDKASRIYRINDEYRLNGTTSADRRAPAAMAATLVRDFPQIEQAVRIVDIGTVLIKKDNQTLVEKNAFSADSNLFKVFTLPLLEGDQTKALTTPNSIVISETVAKQYFNNLRVLGKTLLINNTTACIVTGVLKDTPLHSHIHFNIIRPLSGNKDAQSTFWLSNNYTTYVLVHEGVTQKSLNEYLRQTTKRYAEPQIVSMTQTSVAEMEKQGNFYRYLSIPLLKIHLYSDLSTEIEPSGNIEYVYIFILIGLIILSVACINFMNLSTAKSAIRSREVGVRKVMGSSRKALIGQFLTESIMTSYLGLLLAIGIAIGLVPFLNHISGKEISLANFPSMYLFLMLVLFTALVGIVAGSYPAFFLSGYQPVEALKGIIKGKKENWLRNTLVIFQFTTAIVLIIGTLVIFSQLSFIRSKNLGYNRDQVLVVKNAYSLGGHAETFKNEVLAIKGVISGTRTSSLPTGNPNEWNVNAYSKDPTMNTSKLMSFVNWYVDPDYLKTLGMSLADGRNFSASRPLDSNAIIINETAVRLLGLKQPLQTMLYAFNDARSVVGHPIIGITKDINASSLRYKTQPLIFELSKMGDRFCFRLESRNIPGILAQIESRYHSMNKMAGQPFIYSFMDEDFNKLYDSEQRTGKIFFSFAFFAILIACLGLFGLVTYSAEQRTKEIGIRKVLGASITNVITLLSANFLRLILIAVCIAFPISYFLMNQWLHDFAYRTSIGWWVFALAALVILVVTVITTSYQALRAALANPVDSIRTE